jgi:hypothetical protein
MFFTIDEIMKQNRDIFKWYKNARKIWEALLIKWDISKQSNIDGLANDLWKYQHSFERHCGGKTIGQEIMVITGIVQFYNVNVGFEQEWNTPNDHRLKKAINVYKAFQRSSCSMEVKFTAKNVAKSYGLETNYQ